MTETCQISVARWPEDIEAARLLLGQYARYLEASPVAAAGFCFTGFAEEIRALPGKYGSGQADLLVARVHGGAAGCVAVTRRQLADGTRAVELKRLWVAADFRRQGVGRALVVSAIEWSRDARVHSVVLDTVQEAMAEATALYRSLGFEEIDRFNDNPVAGVHFYRLRLTRSEKEL